MPTITEALVTEHAVFGVVFDQIESTLPKAGSAQEVKLLAAVVEGMLSKHGETEAHLAYSALDHVLEEKGRLNRLHQDHREVDERFKRVHRAKDLAAAKRLLKKALAVTREHFRREEDIVFPFLERVLRSQTVESLGESWMSSHAAPARSLVRNRVSA